MRILTIEDDIHLLTTIKSLLEEENYSVDSAKTGDVGAYLAEQGIYDLLILDIMLPGMEGLKMIRHLRSRGVLTPILLLTAKDSLEDTVKGLDTGADDYMTKPFEVRELLARVRALLRRQAASGKDGELNYHRLSLDMKRLDAVVDGRPIGLTQKECELLEFMMRNREQILTREQICSRVWGLDSDIGFQVVDVYVFYLRRKLKPVLYDHVVQTVRNVGYMLKENVTCLTKPESG